MGVLVHGTNAQLQRQVQHQLRLRQRPHLLLVRKFRFKVLVTQVK